MRTLCNFAIFPALPPIRSTSRNRLHFPGNIASVSQHFSSQNIRKQRDNELLPSVDLLLGGERVILPIKFSPCSLRAASVKIIFHAALAGGGFPRRFWAIQVECVRGEFASTSGVSSSFQRLHGQYVSRDTVYSIESKQIAVRTGRAGRSRMRAAYKCVSDGGLPIT